MESPEVALAMLGATAAEVAKVLTATGIKGRRQNMRHDPIGRYLTSLGYGQVAVFVNEAGDGITVNTAGWVDIAAPPAVVEFVRGFDLGEYPALEE